MTLFATLFLKLIVLYLMIALGFVARKHFTAERETVSRILIYLVVPFVFFYGAMNTPITVSVLILPIIVALISCALCMIFLRIGKRCWSDSTANLLAFTSGNANTGYFGLPVAMMLFDATGVGIYLTIMIGTTIYENTLGFYVAARGNYSAHEAIQKLLRLPSLYAFVLGAVLHGNGLDIPDFANDFFVHMRGAYTVLGMMIIGMGLASVRLHAIDWKFISLSFFAKFFCYPFIVVFLVGIDNSLLHLFTAQMQQAFLLLSLMPLAANSVVFATLLDIHPEKAASSVFLSTLFALFYVPLMASVLLK